jgi:hypothetical protein
MIAKVRRTDRNSCRPFGPHLVYLVRETPTSRSGLLHCGTSRLDLFATLDLRTNSLVPSYLSHSLDFTYDSRIRSNMVEPIR